ncbi:MAG: carboxypeptidase-like regulatory domain-containing protein [Bryobacteraceae bacterium]
MDALIAFSAIRGKQMLPFVKVDDRAHMEPLAVESAAETARVAADVIHTLLKLTSSPAVGAGGSLIAHVSAPAMDGMENLPAKLVLMGTDYSTLSEESLPDFHRYRGTFSLRDVSPGAYRLAIERVGSQTLYVHSLVVRAGETVRTTWTLRSSRIDGNLVPNPDLTLRWLTPDAPDHWRFDTPRHQWISDNIPVVPGRSYRAGCELDNRPSPSVELQWMAHAWQAMKAPTEPLDFSKTTRPEISITAPASAIFVRFIVKAQGDPSSALKTFFIKAERP